MEGIYMQTKYQKGFTLLAALALLLLVACTSRG